VTKSEENTRNTIRSDSLSGSAVQARDVGSVRQYNLPLLSAVVGAVIVLVTGTLVYAAVRSNEVAGMPAAVGNAGTANAPIRLSRQPAMSDSAAYDKVIPAGTELEYDDVVENFSERSANTALTQAEWLQARGAVGVEEGHWEFGLDGMRDHTVQIVDVRPVEMECGPPLGGTLLSDPTSGNGPTTLAVDLDEPDPKFHIEEAYKPPKTLFEQKIDLPKDETIPIIVVARTTKGHCRFNIRIQYTADGVEDSMIIDAKGRPFEVTGRIPDEKYQWVYLSGLSQCTESYRLTGAEFANFDGTC
jgi:hypothetical protein